MTPDRSFSVEDFLQAITNQLDRTQDALRLKSVNRPLTYAIRDFSMELKVFVELADDGRVVFRPSASDDTGASVVHIGFTTVNRTMIEENTVSLSAVRSPSLDELGLDEQERRQLERVGVRNAAQLDELRRTTSESTVSRYSGLPVNRLREAMALGRPRVQTVRAVPVVAERADGARTDPLRSEPTTDGPGAVARPGPADRAGLPDRVSLPARTRRIVLGGRRLDEATHEARLAGRPVPVRAVDGGIELDLGDDATDGTLEVDLGDDGVVAMGLEFEPSPAAPDVDPWRNR